MLPVGYYRAVIAGWIVFPSLLGLVCVAFTEDTYYTDPSDSFIPGFLIGIFIYYALSALGIWVYKGFVNK